MTLRVMGKAQNLAESDCLSCCQRLWTAFDASIQNHTPAVFLQVLDEVLAQTTAVDDDAHIWQDALSILEQRAGTEAGRALITPARIAISERMQQQHYHYIIRQRWVNSRLSLLTASLLTALDEEQIYAILAQHLPVMNIRMARIALFENRPADVAPSIKVRNVLNLQQQPTVIPSFDFPPQDLIPSEQPFHLALIPLTDPNGQLGFAVFGNEYFELYGAIVQQLGGALNTANLYRMATEGRRLAEEANRMKSRFLSTISHELRTPLNLIMGLSGMVLEACDQGDNPLPDAIQKDIERVHAYSQHLGGLIGDVLDLATSDAGELRLNLELLDLVETLRIVAESGRQLSADKGLAWEEDLPEAAIWVNGDRTRLRQVALNLINNAIKFTEHGSIRLQIKLDAPGFARVQVTDTGLGIPLPEQESIFAEFRQSERSVALGYGGMGLGLAISRRLVEMHAGNIGVFSSGKEGAGSTFYFTLPTAVYNGDQAVKLLSDHKAGRNIVLLTRSPVASEQLRMNLARRGIHVQVLLVSSPADWQSQIQEALPDAILLDVSVASDLDWRNLKSLRRQKASPVPVLFFNTSEDNGSVLEMDYLTKPIELSELTRALDQHWLMADASRQQRTVLVVDDDPNTLEMHARIVQSHSRDNRVLTAQNGREALAVLQQEVVDLVLLDLQMPEMDGFAVLQAMREKEDLLKIPVIVVTGKVLHEADMARLNQGVTAVLGKGLFSLEETVTHISTALERKRRLSGEAQRLVRKAMAYIHEHFADPISRKEIAQYVSISEDHLTFCFRQETGATPIDYLQRFRVSEAKHLLKDTDRTITEIALDVGFSDSGYFSRIFRRSTGKSPEAFRRSD